MGGILLGIIWRVQVRWLAKARPEAELLASCDELHKIFEFLESFPKILADREYESEGLLRTV